MKKSVRAHAVKQWGAVADGRINAQTRAWLASVAKSLLESEAEKDGNRRRAQIVRAVGLLGSARDKQAEDEMIRHVDGLDAFDLISELKLDADRADEYHRTGLGPRVEAELKRRLVVRLLDLPESELDDPLAVQRINKRIQRARKASQ